MMRTRHRAALRSLRRRASPAREEGFTMVEMLTVMVVLTIILAPLAGSFVHALAAQVDQTRRFDAQQAARQALDRMRKDIHCAHGVTDPYVNDSGGNTIVMTETNVTGTAECPGLVQTNASAVQWCTVPVDGATDRYRLYRENDPDNLCDGVGSTFMVDYLTKADLWESPTCVTSQYPTVAVTMPVDVDPVHHPAGSYELSDRIALRNGDICS
ncbi:MAG TPA: prepilin-type N-terminal cleavage/methylation domain-containing protein [Gaiellaceae bacterium]|nr:prepilin-type N-terminal cleavage/methylation domain-containing protein [Gaiellaceae bacterium]